METLDPTIPRIEKLLAESRAKEEGGDIQTAVSCAQQALAESQQADAVHLLPQAQVQLAHILVRIGQYPEASRLAAQALDQEPSSTVMVDAWIVLGVCAAETNNPSGGENDFHRAADLSRKIGYSEGLARALHNLASCVHLPRGQFDLALTVMEQSQQVRNRENRSHWGLPFLQAYIYETIGNRKRARQALDELLPQVHSGTRVAGAYFYLWARLALDEEELERAEEYLRLHMRIANTTGAPDLSIWARLESSRFHRLKGEPATALTWAEDALRYARRLDFEFLAGQSLIEAAQAAWESGEHETAKSYLLEAEQVLTPLQASYDLARAAFLRATWGQQTHHPEAEQSWLEAARALTRGGYMFILERERDTAFPLLATYLRSRNAAARQAAEVLLQGLARVAPPPLRINGLGEFIVWQGRRPVADQGWQRRKAGELFRFLLLQPNHASGREVILEALWPENPPQAAIDLLHQATSTLRHILEPDLPDKFPSRYLNVEGERVALRLPEGSSVDFDEFEHRLPSAIIDHRLDRLEEALALYRNDLFPMDRYSEWSTGRREQLSELYQRGLLALGQANLEAERYLQAVDCSRRILQRDPWNEDAVLLGMQASLGLQDAPRAIRMYQKLEAILKEDLDLSPRSDLRELVEKLRANK